MFLANLNGVFMPILIGTLMLYSTSAPPYIQTYLVVRAFVAYRHTTVIPGISVQNIASCRSFKGK